MIVVCLLFCFKRMSSTLDPCRGEGGDVCYLFDESNSLFTTFGPTFPFFTGTSTDMAFLAEAHADAEAQAQVQEPQEQVGEVQVGNVNSANSPVVVS